MNINPSSPTFVHIQRDDSGYGSPLIQQDYSSPQQSSSSSYYPYAHHYHPHLAYTNTSFHNYDQNLMHSNLYSVPRDLCLSPPTSVNTTINTTSTPSKEIIQTNSTAPSDYKIHWAPPQGRRRRQRTVFTQSHVQQLDCIFMHNQYPDIELRESLAAQMGVPESRIQVWFKNRRTRARTAHRQQMKLAEASSSN